MKFEEARAALSEEIASKDKLDAIIKELRIDNDDRIGQPEIKEKSPDTGLMVVTQDKRPYSGLNYLVPSEHWTEYRKLTTNQSGSVACYTLEPQGTGLMSSSVAPSLWWIKREWLRHVYCVHDLFETAELQTVNTNLFYPALRVNKVDPTTVTYVPDASFGERDRRITTTLGRVLRKLYPAMPDDSIRDMEAAHRANLSNEVEFVTGKAIVEAYLNGVGSCMSKPANDYGVKGFNGRDLQPVEAYDSPDLALAVTRGGDGRVTGRCLTFVNPNDPTDKRYIRVYGDPVLGNRLKRLGYRHAGLAGARLKHVPVKCSNYRVVLMPYLDAPPELHARYFVADRDYLYMLDTTGNKAHLPENLRTLKAQATGSSATVIADEGYSESFTVTCQFTGATFDRRKVTFDQVWDGEKLQYAAAGQAEVHGFVACHLLPGVQVAGHVHGRQVWARPAATCTYEGAQYVWPGSGEGYVRLSEKFYPASTVTRQDDASSYDVGYIRFEDTVDVIVHKDDVDQLERTHKTDERLVALKRFNSVATGRPCYITEGVRVVKTVAGRRAVPGIHAVRQLFDGTWYPTSKVTRVSELGQFFYVPKDKPATIPELFSPTAVDQHGALSLDGLKAVIQSSYDYERDSNDRSVLDAKIHAFGRLVRVTPVLALDGTSAAWSAYSTYRGISATAWSRVLKDPSCVPAGVNGVRGLGYIWLMQLFEQVLAPVPVPVAEPVAEAPLPAVSLTEWEPEIEDGRYVVAA